MRKNYTKPEVEKISFNYRDQVVAASPGGEGEGSSTGGDNGFMQNSMGLGSLVCGSGGIVDRVFDFFSSICE